MRSLVPKKTEGTSRWHDLGRDHEHQPVGHDDEFAAYHDVGLAIGIVRSDQLISKSDLAGQVRGPWLFGEERIGPSFDEASSTCSVTSTPPKRSPDSRTT